MDDADRHELAGLPSHRYSAVRWAWWVSRSQIPSSFLLGPIAGVLVDRWDRHRTLIATQALSMIQSFALAGGARGGLVKVWVIVVVALFRRA